MSDDSPPSPDHCRQLLADRLNKAEIDTQRFIDVNDGEKGTLDHTQFEHDSPSLSGNYGVYAGDGEGNKDKYTLIDADIDDYNDDINSDALERVRSLPPTFTVASPHTNGDSGGHEYYAVRTDKTVDDFDVEAVLSGVSEKTAEAAKDDPVALTIAEACGKVNPTLSWGELRLANQYVVGPGSQLDECDKNDHDCSKEGEGYYRIADNREIAVIDVDTLIDLLRADGKLKTDATTNADSEERDTSNATIATPATIDDIETPPRPSDEEIAKRLQQAFANQSNGTKMANVYNGDYAAAEFPDDRSSAEKWLACELAEWFGPDPKTVARILDNGNLQKWDNRKDPSYRNYVLEDVDERDWPTDLERDPHYATKAAETDSGDPAEMGEEAAATSGGRDWDLAPWAVMRKALSDPHGRLTKSDDDGPTVHDLRANEMATYVWDVMKDAGRNDVLAASNGLLRAYDDGVWTDDGEQRLREYGHKALSPAYSSRILDQLVEETKARNFVQHEDLGAPDGTLAVENGLLDLLDGELEELTRSHLALHRAPVTYDPDVPEPNRWLTFLDESIRDDKDRRKFQEYAGYLLWHHAQPFGKAMFLVGPTDSGKGTALKAIEGVIGAENISHESLYDLMQTRWGPAVIHDKAANIRDEVTPGGLKNVQRFKELTGGEDRISAEFKGQQKFQFTVTQKFMFATNEVPRIEAADEAFYNRCLFVRFPDTVPPGQQDPGLLDALTAEKAGILNWMLDGLRRLMEQEAFTGERNTGGKKELCNAFGSVVERFTYTCLDVTGNSDDVIAKSDLYDLAQAYAEQIDREPDWNAQSGFTRILKNTDAGISDGQKRLDGTNTKVFTGIRLVDGVTEEANTDVAHRTTDDRDGGQQSLS